MPKEIKPMNEREQKLVDAARRAEAWFINYLSIVGGTADDETTTVIEDLRAALLGY